MEDKYIKTVHKLRLKKGNDYIIFFPSDLVSIEEVDRFRAFIADEFPAYKNHLVFALTPDPSKIKAIEKEK